MFRIRIWQVEWQTINILVFLLLSVLSPFFILLLSEVWATWSWLKDFSSVSCAVTVHSSLCSESCPWSWGEPGVNEWFWLWSASLPPLSFSLYLGIYLRILLFLFYLLVLQQILFRPFRNLLKLPRVQTDNLISCPCLQEERRLWVSLNTVAPCWEWWCSWSNTIPQKEFGFLSCCSHLMFPYFSWIYTIYFIHSSLNKYFYSSGFKIWFCSLNKWTWTINYYNFKINHSWD